MKTGQNHAPKVYELVETQTERSAPKPAMSVPYVHLYETYAIACDGEKTIRVPLTTEQHVQILADSADIVARVVRWEWRDVKPGKDRPATPDGNL